MRSCYRKRKGKRLKWFPIIGWAGLNIIEIDVSEVRSPNPEFPFIFLTADKGPLSSV